jgi:hypothetical protein
MTPTTHQLAQEAAELYIREHQYDIHVMKDNPDWHPSMYNNRRDGLTAIILTALQAQDAEREKAGKDAQEKLDYVYKLGLRFGMMKSSDKPEPYLMHEWDENSSHARMFREWSHSIGWENTVAKLNAELTTLRQQLDERTEELAKTTKVGQQVIEAADRELTALKSSLATAERERDEARSDYESTSNALHATRQLSIDAMDEVRRAAGAPPSREDKTSKRAVDYVADLKSAAGDMAKALDGLLRDYRFVCKNHNEVALKSAENATNALARWYAANKGGVV